MVTAHPSAVVPSSARSTPPVSVPRSARRLSNKYNNQLLLSECTATSRKGPRARPRVHIDTSRRVVTLASASSSSGTYDCWSNPTGAALSGPFRPDVYAAERAFVWNGIDVGGRSAVVRLSDGSLWVHSPVALDGELRAGLDGLGPVKYIVSPNFEHVKYAQQWISEFGDAATSYCPPGGKAHFPGIDFAEEVGLRNMSPREWGGEIECLFLDYEHNPFTSKPFFNEVLFLHKPSKTLLCTDLFWNYPSSDLPAGTVLWKFGMDRVYRPFYNSLMIKDGAARSAAMAVLMEEWDWDAILPCHGSFIPSGGKDAMRKHLNL